MTPNETAYLPVVHINGLGEERYQPRLPNNYVLVHTFYGDWRWERYSAHTYGTPNIYKSRARAIRISKRAWKKQQKNNWRPK